MSSSIKIIIVIFICLSFRLYAIDDNPPLIFFKAERINDVTTRIPFKLIDHLIVVEAALLDKIGNFIIDTGSESLILNSNYFRPTRKYREDGQEKNGIHNSIDNVRQKHLEALSMNSLNLNQLNADIVDLSSIENLKRVTILGIIGFDVLKNFEVFIDLHLNQITLTKIDKYGNHLAEKIYAERIQDSLDFKLNRHTIIINAFVGKRKVQFGLDSAAEYNQLNETIDSKILAYFYPGKKLSLTGASGKQIQVLAGKLYRVSLKDSIYLGPMKTVLTDLKKMNSAFSSKLDGILGFEFLMQKRTIINYKKRKLYFIKSPITTH
jgi:hypothetical protein